MQIRSVVFPKLVRRALATIGAGLVAAFVLVAGCRGQESTRQATSEPAAGQGSRPAGAMKAHVDPETGELVDTAPPGAATVPGDVKLPSRVVEKELAGGGVVLEPADEADEQADEKEQHGGVER